MADLETPLNLAADNNTTVLNEQYFKLQVKNHTKLYTFKKKNVHTFFNLLLNFVGQKISLNSNNST